VRSGKVLNSSSGSTGFDFQPGHLYSDRDFLGVPSVPANEFEQEWNADQQGQVEEIRGKGCRRRHFVQRECSQEMAEEGRFGAQRSGLDSRHYFLKSSGCGTQPLSAIEELLRRQSSGSGLENLEYGSRDPLR
jgi:hypothetical protein